MYLLLDVRILKASLKPNSKFSTIRVIHKLMSCYLIGAKVQKKLFIEQMTRICSIFFLNLNAANKK